MALLMVFSGKGYYGMQNQPEMQTIEGELWRALFAAGVITKEHLNNTRQVRYLLYRSSTLAFNNWRLIR